VRSPVALIGAALATFMVLQPQAASAAWAAAGTGNAPAAAGSVQRAAAPTVTQVGAAVRLDWAAVTLSEGTPATGYTVVRHAGAATTQVCTTVAPARTCTDSAPVPGAVQYGVIAKYQSWSGQESPLTSFSLDVAPPVTTLSSNPAPNGAGWNKSAVTLTLTATDASAVANITYRIGAGSPVTVAGSSTSFPVSAQGSTAITYSATDTYGNVESTKSYTVKLDTTAPNAPVMASISNDSGTAGDRVTNVATQTLSGTAEAGATVTVSRGATTFPSVVVAANGSYSVPVTLVEGANSFTAVAVDQAGNTSSTSGSFSVTLDTVLPALTTTDPRSGVAYKDSSGPTSARWANTCAGVPGACGTSSDSGSGVTTVKLTLRDTTANTCWTGTGVTYAACGGPVAVTGTTTWSKAIAYAVVTGRSLQLTLSVTDLAGNVTTGSATFSAA
jgi:large repetitive protein